MRDEREGRQRVDEGKSVLSFVIFSTSVCSIDLSFFRNIPDCCSF